MDSLVKIVHDGSKNTSIQVTGQGKYDWITVVDLNKLNPVPREVRVDAVYYAVSEGMEVQFAWHSDLKRVPFLPLGGRGRIDFGEISGIHNNAKGKTGHIEMRTQGLSKDGIFTVILDLSKHIGVKDA